MDKKKFQEDLGDKMENHFEDIEDYIEFVSQKIEDATFHWQILRKMFMPEITQDESWSLFVELNCDYFLHYERRIDVREIPEKDGPFKLFSINQNS